MIFATVAVVAGPLAYLTGPSSVPLSLERGGGGAPGGAAIPGTGASHPTVSKQCQGVNPDELIPSRPAEWNRTLDCAAQYAAATSGAVPGWAPGSSVPPAFEAYSFTMTYDASDQYLLLFGTTGSNTAPFNGTETWTYSRGNWTELFPSISPVSCTGSAMAYDQVDQYVVFLGGATLGGSTCPSAGQTWTYHGGVWSQLHLPASPPVRDDAAFANDSADGYLVLFGGYSYASRSGLALNDTWSFVHGSWTNLTTPASPVARASAGMTYDFTDGFLLLWGGTAQSGKPLNDTWSFLAGKWTELHPANSPGTGYPDGLMYDVADSEAIYTSASNITHAAAEQVWLYKGGNWAQWVPGSGNDGVVPPQRLGEATAYDWSDGFGTLFGGTGENFAGFNDFWSFHAGNWTNRSAPGPSPRFGAATTFDAADGYFLLFGGASLVGSSLTYYSDTWAWSNGAWRELTTNVSPPARAWAGLTYDAVDGYVLLFGGDSAIGPLNDTWEFTNGGWSEITPKVAPPADESGSAYGVANALAYDPADGYSVLLDVTSSTSTWVYGAGTWTELALPATATPKTPANPIAYDAADGRLVLFGTTPTNTLYGATNETWTFLNGTWSNVTASVGPTPAPRFAASVAENAMNGSVLLFGGTNTFLGGDGAILNDTWEFEQGAWHPLFSALSPTARYDASLASDPAAGVDVLFGGQGTQPACPGFVCSDTWMWTPHASYRPVVESFVAAPNPIDLGTSVTLTVNVIGGFRPYNFSYSGLPTGCRSANTSVLSCTPTETGTFPVTVNVTDSSGNETTATVSLSVGPGLSLVSFVALPSSTSVGQRTLLSVTVAGGVAPYSYVYTGLPPGCSSQTVPTLPCAPWSTGTYTVQVNASDAEGSFALGSLALTVNASGTTGGPRIVSFAIAPAAITLGNSTSLFVNATDGAGPLSYVYSGLPAGCATANTTRLACAPTSSGLSTIGLLVVDRAGRSASVEANLTVYPVGGGGSALISTFGAAPNVLVLGEATVISVVASGGAGPLSYTFADLPPGCSGMNTSRLPCAPTETGNYSIFVLVSDSAGHRTGARGALDVLPTTPGPPHGGGGSAGPSGIPYLGWLVGLVVGAVAALGLTDLALRRRTVRREGERIVQELNDEAERSRPPL
jgi:hypothetical protein